jgi:hypothetical protein
MKLQHTATQPRNRDLSLNRVVRSYVSSNALIDTEFPKFYIVQHRRVEQRAGLGKRPERSWIGCS